MLGKSYPGFPTHESIIEIDLYLKIGIPNKVQTKDWDEAQSSDLIATVPFLTLSTIPHFFDAWSNNGAIKLYQNIQKL